MAQKRNDVLCFFLMCCGIFSSRYFFLLCAKVFIAPVVFFVFGKCITVTTKKFNNSDYTKLGNVSIKCLND